MTFPRPPHCVHNCVLTMRSPRKRELRFGDGTRGWRPTDGSCCFRERETPSPLRGELSAPLHRQALGGRAELVIALRMLSSPTPNANRKRGQSPRNQELQENRELDVRNAD